MPTSLTVETRACGRPATNVTISGGLRALITFEHFRSLQLNANYTWSHATDETIDYNSDVEPNNQFCRRCDRASSSFDQRHKALVPPVL
jgi:hypothetical protein